MKKNLPLLAVIAAILLSSACSRKHYTTSFFDQQTQNHKTIAVLPAEMVFTGKQPKELTEQDINKIEEEESRSFQMSLYSSILRYANNNRYYMFVNVQDINKTVNTLQDNNISIRESWRMDDKKLAELLGVDAIVKMQIIKKRYMSDYASYGVTVARSVIRETPLSGRIPLPGSLGKTEDISAYCSVASNNVTLWNNHYRGSANWDNPSNIIIENITNSF
jgi:hypothetical protein